VNGLDRLGVDRCQVLGNRLVGVRGDGIHIGGTIASAMIKHNVIQDPGGGGIVMDADAEARTLTVENNQILGVAPRANARGTTLAGIQLVQVAAGDVSSNTVAGLGRQATDADQAVGIRVEAQAAGTVRIAGNDVSDVGPNVDGVGIDGSVRNIGIQVTGSFDRADVVDNSVRRSRVTPDPRSTDTEGRWRAVEIRGVIQRKRLEIEMLELDDLERMERLSTVERAAEVERAEVDSEASAAWMTWRTRSYVVPPDAVRDEYIGIIAGRATKLPAGREIAAARGNLLDGYGTGSSLVVAVAGAATATDNRATLSGNGTSVRIEAEAAIIASNYVVGPPETTPIELRLPANGPFTVVGNISSGPIEVNGQELSATVAGAPFAPLNVSAS